MSWSLIPLAQFSGLHPDLLQLFQDLSIPPLRQIPPEILAWDRLASLLEVFPIVITRDGKNIWCTGNVRLFHQLLASGLSSQTPIPCREEPAMSTEQLKRRALDEILFGAASLGMHTGDAKTIMAISRRAIKLNQLDLTENNAEKLISAIYGVDRRTLKGNQSISKIAI